MFGRTIIAMMVVIVWILSGAGVCELVLVFLSWCWYLGAGAAGFHELVLVLVSWCEFESKPSVICSAVVTAALWRAPQDALELSWESLANTPALGNSWARVRIC